VLSPEAHVHHQYHLPTALEVWRKPSKLDDWWKPWEYLRSFFKECGYELYKRDTLNVSELIPLGTVQNRRPDALGVYGTRSYVPMFHALVSGNPFRCHSALL
jgi:hypothetical protein